MEHSTPTSNDNNQQADVQVVAEHRGSLPVCSIFMSHPTARSLMMCAIPRLFTACSALHRLPYHMAAFVEWRSLLTPEQRSVYKHKDSKFAALSLQRDDHHVIYSCRDGSCLEGYPSGEGSSHRRRHNACSITVQPRQ